MIAPANELMPPITITDTRAANRSTANRESANETRWATPASRPPPSPAIAPDRANVRSFTMAGGPCRPAAEVELSRTARVTRPTGLRRSRPRTAMSTARTARMTK